MDGRAASVETDDMTHIRHIHGGREHNHIRAVLARKLPKAKISGPGTRIQHTLSGQISSRPHGHKLVDLFKSGIPKKILVVTRQLASWVGRSKNIPTPVPHSDMDVSENRGTPNHPFLIGFSIINHPFWGTHIFGNPHIFCTSKQMLSRLHCKESGA